MVEKICRHCGATVLVGLEYCPGCLHPVRGHAEGAASAVANHPAPRAPWQESVAWFTASLKAPVEKYDPLTPYDRSDPGATTSMSEPYTRVVCPKCNRPHRAPLNQSPSARFVCAGCFHQFPASMAAEFRKGADLVCFRCDVTTFCVNGLRVNACPNCKARITRPHDPEKAKLILFATVVGLLLITGFTHAATTGTMPQFLTWLLIGSVFTFFGFIAMVALGF